MIIITNDRIESARDLVKSLDLDKTVFYFDKEYHRVMTDGWLRVIPADEAEQCLKSHEYSLWSLGDPPTELPESCPSWIYTNIWITVPAGEFLQLVFNLHYQESIISNINKN